MFCSARHAVSIRYYQLIMWCALRCWGEANQVNQATFEFYSGIASDATFSASPAGGGHQVWHRTVESGLTVMSQVLQVSPEGFVIFRVPHMPLGLEKEFLETKSTCSATV